MPTKPRELGNNAANAVDDIDELLEDNRRVLLGALTALFQGDINMAGEGIALALDNNSTASRIAVLTRTNKFDDAARVLDLHRQKKVLSLPNAVKGSNR